MKRHFVFATGALVVLAAAWVWWLGQPGPSGVLEVSDPSRTPRTASRELEIDDAARQRPDVRTTPPTVELTASAVASPAAWPPLPDATLPLREQLDALLERARAGDPIASCRLVMEGFRCDDQWRSESFAKLVQRSVELGNYGGGEDLGIRAIAATQERVEASGGYCDGVDSEQLPSIDDMLRNALPRLSARQKVLIAMTREDGRVAQLPRMGRGPPSIRSGTSTDYLVPQFLADHDIEFIQAGLDAADPLALQAAVMLYAPSPLAANMAGLRQRLPNPQRFSHYGLLLRQLQGDEALGELMTEVLDNALARMSPERVEAVRQAVARDAERWHRMQLGRTVPALPERLANNAKLCAE